MVPRRWSIQTPGASREEGDDGERQRTDADRERERVRGEVRTETQMSRLFGRVAAALGTGRAFGAPGKDIGLLSRAPTGICGDPAFGDRDRLRVRRLEGEGCGEPRRWLPWIGGMTGCREEALEEERMHQVRVVSEVLVGSRSGEGGTYSAVARLRGTSDEGLRLTLQVSGCMMTVSRDSVAEIRPLGDRWG